DRNVTGVKTCALPICNLVDSAGFHSHRIAAMAGIELPVRPRKRCVFVFDCKTPIERAPLTIDPTGVYFRPEGASFICGVAPPDRSEERRVGKGCRGQE